MLSWLARYRMFTVVLACLSLVASFSIYVLGQPIDNRPGRFAISMLNFVESTRERSPFHARRFDVMTSEILDNIGGVLSQGDELFDDSGNLVKVAVQLDYGDGAFHPGLVIVHETGSQASTASYSYSTAYNDLVPMVLFVESGGTSLYTYWEDLPPDFSGDAGFMAHSTKGMVALEFHDTHYAESLRFVDTCACAGPPDEDLDSIVNQINQINASIPVYGELHGSYINTDVDLPFSISIHDDRLFLDGNIARFYWKLVDDRIVISKAGRLVRSYQRVDDVFFLFKTLALLRSAKISSPDGWSTFLRELVASADTNPEPWNRYVESFCSVYPNNENCP